MSLKNPPIRPFTFTVTVHTNHCDKAFAVRDEVAQALQDAADSSELAEDATWDVGTVSVECIRAPEVS